MIYAHMFPSFSSFGGLVTISSISELSLSNDTLSHHIIEQVVCVGPTLMLGKFSYTCAINQRKVCPKCSK